LSRLDPPFQARLIVGQLTEHGIQLPAAVADAYAKLEAVTFPPEIEQNAVATAIADGRPAPDVQKLLIAQEHDAALRQATAVAKNIAASRVLSAIRAHADDLFEALRPLAEQLIDDIHAAAAIGDIPLTALVRAGRHDESRLIVALEENDTKLQQLFRLRNSLYGVTRTAIGTVDVSQYKRPVKFTSATALSSDNTEGARWNAIVNKGGELWWSKPSQWQDAAQPFLSAELEQADKTRIARLSLGFRD
jgi:hypothetical protein